MILMNLRKWLYGFLVLIILSVILTPLGKTYASEPYNGYNYNEWRVAVPAPNSYMVEKIIETADLGITGLNEPQDIFVDSDKNLYIADTGNNRIVVLDSSFKLLEVIDKFNNKGKIEKLNKPAGIFVNRDGKMYIADSENQRVIAADRYHNVINLITLPKSDLIPQNTKFNCKKVLEGTDGVLYVLVDDVYRGAFSFDSDGKFIGFYGANQVETSAQLIKDLFWRRFFTDTQKAKMQRYVPVSYANFDVDKEGFIYTCTRSTQNSKDEVKKFNPMGINVLKTKGFGGDFGDLDHNYTGFFNKDSSFRDISVSDKGYIYLLDDSRGRVFQYDQEGNLVSIFGGLGNERGTFKTAAAIDKIDDYILVLDSSKSNITVFYPTTYGKTLMDALDLYNNGYYEEALGHWQKVLALNGNNQLAYIGIGKGLEKLKRYDEALEKFKFANSKDYYNEVFQVYRNYYLRENFSKIMIIIILLYLSISIIIKYRTNKKRQKDGYSEIGEFMERFKRMNGIDYLKYSMFHPLDGFWEMKYNNKGSIRISIFILAIWYFSSIFSRLYTGFIFNNVRTDKINILMIFASTIVLFFLWVISNWCVCSISYGKGRFKEIWIVSAYSLVPYICGMNLYTIISNFITKEEGAFLMMAFTACKIWSLALIVCSLISIHDFTLKKVFSSVVFTVLGIGFIIFNFVLVFSLSQQIYRFAYTIYNEILLRL